MRARELLTETWSKKYKSSINCSHPKGFSQKAHCAGKKKHNESVEMEMVCEDCGMCRVHSNLNEAKTDSNRSVGAKDKKLAKALEDYANNHISPEEPGFGDFMYHAELIRKGHKDVHKQDLNTVQKKYLTVMKDMIKRHLGQNITEATKVGREWQHLEDLVFVDGSQGALQAANILKNLGSGATELNIKWDGRIALYWGREPDGTFVLVGKNGWGKEKHTTPADMQNAITTAGKGEEWRQKLGADMAQVFSIMEKNTSPQFRGYVMGDLLWYPGEPFQMSKQGITFTPNKVTYTVNPTSDLGKRIAQSSVGIAAHLYYKEFGSSDGIALTDVTGLNGPGAVVLNSRITSYQTKIDTSAVADIINDAKKNGQAIDSLLEPQAGLSDMKGILYTYVNQMSRAGRLNDLATGFFDWLKTSKVSPQKQAKIIAMPQSKSIPVLFNLVLKVQRVKDDIIAQLDQQTSDITATTDGQAGGEGYAANAEKVKLVPRQRWVPS